MEKNDIAPTTQSHVACMFEGLLIQEALVMDEPKRRLWRKAPDLNEDQHVEQIARMWRANEMPLKSVIHLVNQLDVGVEVYTYLDYDFHDAIEHWLARKGAAVQVYHYQSVDDLYEDFRFNRDVHTLFTPYPHEAALLGMRATVVSPEGKFGF